MAGQIRTAFAAALLAAAAADAAGPTSSPAGATSGRIAEWVRQMDADSAAARDQAVRRLIAAGRAAVEPVAKAVRGDSPEVTARGISVLKALLESKDPATAAAARAALEKLAADRSHPAGREAAAALREGGRVITPAAAPGAVVAVGELQVAGGANAVSVAVRQANGRKEVDVTENGRKIRITEGREGIVVAVTEPAVGAEKAKTRQYRAANADELKKKHPEAYALYRKYASGRGAGVVLKLGGVPVGPGPVRPVAPRIVPAPALRPGRDIRRAGELIDQARKELREAREGIARPVGTAPDAEALKALADRLRRIEQRLAESRKLLGR